ncbi:DUF1624 domain-containing protein [Caenorhabditis elegans]|uniref:DUF1624 domain-containing protein n=1 Tax=Caenorhabditis elegans TaxID=6239 RepID=O17177_CAEEL|nr:DUF1624 domain-containing protein [Caenorhabditis elegans]CCD63714.1 DUF1624 domain-containing protein [Caenorhabditis elegans]|eukprot:NP_494078.1 Uncharacterized protein CELE_C08F1.6 [Caenorhabditis elegans]
MSRLYYNYLFLAVEAIGFSCIFHFSYLNHKTPLESFGELVSDVSRNYEWAIFFACGCVLAIVLLNPRFYAREKYTINSFCSTRYLMAAGMICINMLLTGNSIFSLYCSWARAIIEAVIISILCCLAYISINICREKESPIHYRLSNTTTVTNAQKLIMILFLAIFGAFNICSSFIELRQFPDEYTGLGFFYTTRFICPILYILAYNSEVLTFSGVEPTSGRFWYGVCKWNEKLGEWEHLGIIRGKTKSLVLDV